MKFGHGIDCTKAPHSGSGYLHDEDDDSPYSDDGVKYCGRCHHYLSVAEAIAARKRILLARRRVPKMLEFIADFAENWAKEYPPEVEQTARALLAGLVEDE